MLIRQSLKWFGFGLLCYVLLAIYSAPASLAMRALPPALSASGVSGSLWHGEAASIRQGDVHLQDVSWSLKPLRLLTLKAAAEINGKFSGNSFVGTINQSLLGDSGSATAVRSVVDLSTINGLLKLPVPMQGKAGLEFDSLSWKDQLLTAAVGSIQLAKLTEMIAGTELGNFKITFDEQTDDTVLGIIADEEAIVTVNGQIALNGNNYQLQLNIKPTAQTPNSVSTVLAQYAGQPNPQGEYSINSNGLIDPKRAAPAAAVTNE